MAWAEVYRRIKWHLNPSSRLATIDMGQKVGVLFPLLGEPDPHLIQCRLGRGLPRTKWHRDPSCRVATTDISRKLGAVPLWLGGSWVLI